MWLELDSRVDCFSCSFIPLSPYFVFVLLLPLHLFASRGIQDFLFPVDETSGSSTDVATGIWFLRVSLDATNGVLLNMMGTESGGDCDEVRVG